MKDKKIYPKTEVIEAAGGLLWRKSDAGWELAIIHRPSQDDWTLPKGKREPGETWQETALREVWEETGIQAKLGSFAGSIAYLVADIPKVVLFWNMIPIENSGFIPNNEVDQLMWMPFEKALQTVSYSDEIALLKANQFDPIKTAKPPEE